MMLIRCPSFVGSPANRVQNACHPPPAVSPLRLGVRPFWTSGGQGGGHRMILRRRFSVLFGTFLSEAWGRQNTMGEYRGRLPIYAAGLLIGCLLPGGARGEVLLSDIVAGGD